MSPVVSLVWGGSIDPAGVEVVSLKLGLRILFGSQLPLYVTAGVSFSTAPQISYLVVFQREKEQGWSPESAVLCAYTCSYTFSHSSVASVICMKPQFSSISCSHLLSDLHISGKSCDSSVFPFPLHILQEWSYH